MRYFLIILGQILFSLFLYLMGVLIFGLSLVPSLYLIWRVWLAIEGWAVFWRLLILGFSLAGGFFLFGLSLIFIVGGLRSLLRLRLKEGVYPLVSLETVKWIFNSSLYAAVNFTFINFILLTPFVNLLQRFLGARLGKNVQINSRFVFDAPLLEIGDNTVIGGGAVIIGHQVERGFLKLKRVKIGKNVTIGSNAIISPGCEISDNAIIGAGAVLLKNTKVGPRQVWYGVPAQPVRVTHGKEKNETQSQSS